MKKTQQQRALDFWNDLSVDRKVNLCNNHSKSINDITVQEILEIFQSLNSLPKYKDPPPPPVAKLKDPSTFNGDGDNATGFTDEEVKAAKIERDKIFRDNIETLKAIYMAGEICMWDELRWNKRSQNESIQPLTREGEVTAMQEAIEEIAANIDIAANAYTRRGLRIAQTVLTKLLAKEREQIERAFDTGWHSANAVPEASYGKNYFAQTFKQD